MSRRAEWSILVVIAAAILVGVWLYLNSIVSPSPRVDLPPVEENRVTHPDGFSIVLPENSKADVGTAADLGIDQITVQPAWGTSRYTPFMFARRVPEPPTKYETAPHGRFGRESVPVLTGPSNEYEHWQALLKRGGAWYEVGVFLPRGIRGKEPMPTAGWRRYLETFKVEAKKNDDIGSSTRPATEPSR